MKKYKSVYLYKIGRFQEDFEYIFPNVKIKKYITDKKIATYNNKECLYIKDLKKFKNLKKKINKLIVICDRKDQKIYNLFNKLNLQENKDYMFIEDFGKLLDEKKYGIIIRILNNFQYFNRRFSTYLMDNSSSNSELFKKMIYTNTNLTQSVNCEEPFIYAHIQPDGNVYTCCPGHIEEHIGNIFFKKPKQVWNSNRARILRLSIINKTYAFCNLNYCILPKNNDNKNLRVYDIKENAQPLHTNVAFDQTCNLKCKSCRNNVINHNKNKFRNYFCNNITKKLLKSGWLTNSKHTLVAAQGEVFFSKAYQKLLFSKKLKKLNKLIIHTNGTVLNKEKLDALCKKFNKDNTIIIINVSIDSANEETYEKLRIGGKFKVLKKNLEYLSEIKQVGKINYMCLVVVLQKDNYKELPDIVKFAIDLNFDRIDINKIANWGMFTDEQYKQISMYDENGNPKPELEEVLKDPIFKTKEIQIVGNALRINNSE